MSSSHYYGTRLQMIRQRFQVGEGSPAVTTTKPLLEQFLEKYGIKILHEECKIMLTHHSYDGTTNLVS